MMAIERIEQAEKEIREEIAKAKKRYEIAKTCETYTEAELAKQEGYLYGLKVALAEIAMALAEIAIAECKDKED